MLLIDPLIQSPEELELLWLTGLYGKPHSPWKVSIATRGVASGRIQVWRLPIGLLPLLTPGRCFSGGDLLDTALTGTVGTVRIPDLAAGREVGASTIPKPLYSFGGHWGWGQRLLHYALTDGECLLARIS